MGVYLKAAGLRQRADVRWSERRKEKGEGRREKGEGSDTRLEDAKTVGRWVVHSVKFVII